MKQILLALLIGASLPAFAEMPVFQITIKDHRFQPAQTMIPAGQQVKLVVDNQDDTPEEFEGGDFDVEKIIPGHRQAEILVGPFKAGEYKFVGEFHEDTAKGALIVQ
jgi:plastocyanin